MKSQVGKYFVLRTYSHTDRRQLWKVLTRPVRDFLSVDVTADMAKKDCPKGQEVFIARIVDASDAEYNLSKGVNDAWHEGYKECLRRMKAGEQYDFTDV